MKVKRRQIVSLAVAGMALVGLFWLGGLTAQSVTESFVEPQEAPVDSQSALALARAELDATVAEQALELLRGDMVTLRNELEAANEELALYRQMLGVKSLPEGLSVSEMTLWPVSGERQFGYRWVLMQNNKQRESLVVKSRLWLTGQLDGEPVELSFGALGDADEGSLRVRYFTIARGEIELPVGFSPQQLHVELRYSWMKSPQYQTYFDWPMVLQEQISEPPSAISD